MCLFLTPFVHVSHEWTAQLIHIHVCTNIYGRVWYVLVTEYEGLSNKSTGCKSWVWHEFLHFITPLISRYPIPNIKKTTTITWVWGDERASERVFCFNKHFSEKFSIHLWQKIYFMLNKFWRTHFHLLSVLMAGGLINFFFLPFSKIKMKEIQFHYYYYYLYWNTEIIWLYGVK